MITKEKAKEIVLNYLGNSIAVVPNTTIEKENVWVIYVQTKKFLETNDEDFRIVGRGPTLVDKATGKIHSSDALTSLEEMLNLFELGYFKYDNSDIVITKIFNINKATKIILKLELSYVIPEEAYGDIWKIPYVYTKNELRIKLMTIPARFNIGALSPNYSVLESFKKQRAFSYTLEENKGYTNCI